jgi:hypothetical protein
MFEQRDSQNSSILPRSYSLKEKKEEEEMKNL